MMARIGLNCALVMLGMLVVGCGADTPSQPDVASAVAAAPLPPLEIKIPETVSLETKTLLTAAWPKVRKACPGLDVYAKSFANQSVQEGYRPAITVEIPDSAKGVPAEYVARGQRCFFEVSKDGKQLVVAKDACKAICLDHEVPPGDDLTLDLDGR
jgi:hypothetical protein